MKINKFCSINEKLIIAFKIEIFQGFEKAFGHYLKQGYIDLPAIMK